MMRWHYIACALLTTTTTNIVTAATTLAPLTQRNTSTSEAAVVALTQLSSTKQTERIQSIKQATDGLHGAILGIASNDVGKALRGIGDVLVELPGGFGYAGVAFSLAASVFTLASGGPTKKANDPVLAALRTLSVGFHAEMDAIQTHLDAMDTQLSSIIGGIDRVVSGISMIPSKVVAEMQLTSIAVMKDKFANVQRHAMLYAQGNVTRAQMQSKCNDFRVAALFSELETILVDETQLLDARFETLDRANGHVQAQLLGFYIAVLPLVTNCNALAYSFESLDADWVRSRAVIDVVIKRARWLLAPADRVIHVMEQLAPFDSVFAVDGYHEGAGLQLALSFRVYGITPPHGVCYRVRHGGRQLERLELAPQQHVPDASVFCVKAVATDDAPQRIAYAERNSSSSSSSTVVASIVQPEAVSGALEPLASRGWTRNAITFYSPKVGHWQRFPMLTLVADFVVLQAASSKVSLDDLTQQCAALGDGYKRDGDGHSVDYKGAPWTIFCVQYKQLTVREIDAATGVFLSDVQFNEMAAADAWSAKCPDAYVRDKHAIAIPSQVKKSWLTGTSTKKAFAVCLKWTHVTTATAPSGFVQRVWLDDAAAMAEKPQFARNVGDELLALPTPPSVEELAAF